MKPSGGINLFLQNNCKNKFNTTRWYAISFCFSWYSKSSIRLRFAVSEDFRSLFVVSNSSTCLCFSLNFPLNFLLPPLVDYTLHKVAEPKFFVQHHYWLLAVHLFFSLPLLSSPLPLLSFLLSSPLLLLSCFFGFQLQCLQTENHYQFWLAILPVHLLNLLVKCHRVNVLVFVVL